MATSNDVVVACLHGEWIDGACICERGYESTFNDAILDPVYCGDRIVRVLTRSIDPATIVHYLTMSVSLIICIPRLMVSHVILLHVLHGLVHCSSSC